MYTAGQATRWRLQKLSSQIDVELLGREESSCDLTSDIPFVIRCILRNAEEAEFVGQFSGLCHFGADVVDELNRASDVSWFVVSR